MRKYLLMAGAVVLAIVTFLFVIAGGLDKFKPPISIVVPTNYTGAVCIEIVSDNDDQSKNGRYDTDVGGYTKMSENLIRSHRQKKLFRKSPIGAALEPVPDSEWTPVRTEGGQSGNATFMLYWIGAINEIRSNAHTSGNSVCTTRR
jgi:hypothetical protein